MFLKALEIQGFKSFPDRTKVTFEGGITAVVGPNGSGKSNISDAIRWVLGETSSKQLRGAGKMEDVIFGGTQLRGAMGFAAVSLYIDNTAHRLDIENDEVIITRRYYRSGESEYGINGQNVRLKDIYELFLDTGIGRDGYSIIGQGRIAEIVGAKSGERREIFEEASGIAKYRYRKNEAERRLAAAEENLVRLRDILDELTARVGPLEKDCEKAKKFIALAEERKTAEVTLWTDTLRRARDTLRVAARDIETAGADYDRAGAEIENIDAETGDIRTGIERINIEIERYNAEIRSITEQVAGADSAIAVLENDISHNRASIADLSAEIEAAGQSESTITAEIEAEEQKAADLASTIESLTCRIGEVEALLTELSRKSAETGERRGIVSGRLTELAARLTDLKVGEAAALSAKESAENRLAVLAQSADTDGAVTAKAETERADTRALLADCEERLCRCANIKEGLSIKLENRRRMLEEARAAAEQADRSVESAGQRIRILKDLERSMDGYTQSVKYVMRSAEQRRLRGVIGPVSAIFAVENGCETAIETALGAAAQNVVVADEAAAKAAIALLKEDRAGRATFLPLDTVRPSFFDKSRLPAGARLASDLVRYDEKYEAIASNLLGRIVVVEEINAASRAAKALDYRFRIVTMDGQVVNAGGSFTGGSVSRSAGLFTRRTEIEELTGKIAKLTAQRDEKIAAMDKVKAECEKLAAELTVTESEEITASGDKIRAQSELSRIEQMLEQFAAAAQNAEAEKQRLCAAVETASATVAENRAKAAEADAEKALLETELSGIADGDDTFADTRARLSDELGSAKMARLSAEKDAELAAANAAALRRRSGDSAQRAGTLAESIRGLAALITANEEKITALRAQKQQSADAIAGQEAAIREAADRRMAEEASITRQTARVRELQAQREELSREVARQEERKSQLEAEYDTTTQKLWEEYELTPTDAAALARPFDSVSELRRTVGELRGKIRALGNVNVGAIDEYAEVSTRYEFMKTQVGDVEKSKTELEKLIGTLCAEMRGMFSESFTKINDRFGHIFAELFGGGTASLSLADPENVLESGIDITVAPPGKIIKNLSSLSGGEQALVAISIYFAILAVNPAPFCILDEIEAALDDVNVVRYASYLRRITKDTQFIVITHRRGTMEEADVLYGVTMQEDGVSKLLRLKVDEVDVKLIS